LVFLQEGGKSIETFGPKFLISIEPFIGFAHGFSPQSATNDAAIFITADQPRIGEHIEVLHHCRKRHREWRSQFADRKVICPAQAHDQCAPGWIGERGEGAVEIWLQIVNHMVKYNPVRRHVKVGS